MSTDRRIVLALVNLDDLAVVLGAVDGVAIRDVQTDHATGQVRLVVHSPDFDDVPAGCEPWAATLNEALKGHLPDRVAFQ